jgi:hypothetical protein
MQDRDGGDVRRTDRPLFLLFQRLVVLLEQICRKECTRRGVSMKDQSALM